MMIPLPVFLFPLPIQMTNNELIQISKEITLKALEKDLIPANPADYKETAKSIASFFNEISDALSETQEIK